jgi:hypothetical protein
MQPMHLLTLILVVILAFSLARIATRALAKDRRYQFAQGRAAGRIEGRSEKLSAHNALQQEDLQTLVDISTTLNVAHKFWLQLPGTEPYRLRVVEHMNALSWIATRIKDLDQRPSDTQPAQEKAA